MAGRCAIENCPEEPAIGYLGHDICNTHWNHLNEDNEPATALRKALGLEPASPSEEETPIMAVTKKKTNGKKQAGEGKPEKTTKKREPKADRGELRTVALRVSQEEFDLLHKAAGPRNLSIFMKTAILSAADKALGK